VSRRTSRRYRGSRRGGIGILIPVLVILCIIAAASLYVINDNMTFTKDGTFFAEWEKDREPEKVDANLIIETPESDTPTVGEVHHESEKLPTSDRTENDGKRVRFIPIGTVKSEELFDAALAENMEKDKINTILLEVKADDGTLAFGNDHEFVRDKQIVGEDSVLSDAIAKARSSGYKVALYMSCFKDNGAARNNFKNAVLAEGGGVWRDEFETRWLSPYSEEARLYLTDMIKKLISLSPDEIVLSNISFPVAGKTNMISYGEESQTKAEMLSKFIDEAKLAAGDIALTAVYENYNDLYRTASGQEPEVFEKFDTLYVNYKESEFCKSFAEAESSFESTDIRLVPITTDSSASEFIIK